MKSSCGICKTELRLFTRSKVADGYICNNCLQKTGYGASDLKSVSSGGVEAAERRIQRKILNESRLADFKPTKKIGKFLFIDEQKEQWLVPSGILGNKINKSWVYTFADIREFELLENGDSVSSGGLGRAVAGGILFGGVGAVVGGVTGRKKSVSTVTSMQIKITTNDMDAPAVYIDFITGGVSYKTNSLVYREFTKTAQEILSTLSIIIKNGEGTKPVSDGSTDISALREYKKLLDEGVITQLDFDRKKKNILG